ncbi:carbohydrate-binding module family 43 protein [Hypoxylon trugodes]|uniref:carbohydrate-binding module family 43 protein n=1 Tax=Hypoxylon trugodes TaxID=326681 RepID=UPI002198D9B4|nr:carbohydrate-binding module family 43 protein [Hypoxylon trugodes]KAI1390456.1 carbohydrate-binding module family 43 protein [Hypoxylon trugodes]
MGFRSALTTSLLLASNVAAVDPIVMKGSKFFTKSGDQFFIKGVAYQQEAGGGPGGSSSNSNKYVDPLSDATICKRDVPLLEKLGVNTIRTYAIDPKADHSECMSMLDKAGIYVVADLGEPALSINRDSPAWNTKLFDRYKGVVDNLGKYDNVIGFFAGNEVTNNNTNTGASAFVKAATRDVKKYISDKIGNGGRWMGVGYAANDDAEIRANMAQYFNCGEQEQAIDFWGYNIYSWCGKSSFTESGYDVQVKFFSNFSVPVFFAEYGCNSAGADGRLWDETTALYSNQMSGVFSGGIAYMFHEEENDYGLVKVSGNSATPMKNFKVLESKLADVKPSSTSMAAYNPTNSPAACPAISNNWKASEVLPPTPDNSLCDCMYNSLSCVPADDLAEKDFGDIFGYVCSHDASACAGIKQDPKTGVFGPYSMCSPKQQLAHVLNTYYTNQHSSSDACSFDGAAKVVSSPSSDSSCKSSLAKANSAVAVAATATAGSASTASTGETSESSENAAAPASVRMTPFVTMGDMAVSLYVLVAMGAGAGMVLL